MTGNSNHEKVLEIISWMALDRLALMVKHEYDDDVVVPEPGSSGEYFLQRCRSAYMDWVRREGRFPDQDDAEAMRADWRDSGGFVGSAVARAFVDLGLFYSHHADVARGASVAELQKVLDAAAEEYVVNLTGEYGPLYD